MWALPHKRKLWPVIQLVKSAGALTYILLSFAQFRLFPLFPWRGVILHLRKDLRISELVSFPNTYVAIFLPVGDCMMHSLETNQHGIVLEL